MTLKEFRDITKDFPEDADMCTPNANCEMIGFNAVYLMKSKETGEYWIELL